MDPTNGMIIPAGFRDEHAERHGLCHLCCENQVKMRNPTIWAFKRWMPIEEKRNDNGALIVYKGYCLLPTCYSLKDAKKELGEDQSKIPRINKNPISGTVLTGHSHLDSSASETASLPPRSTSSQGYSQQKTASLPSRSTSSQGYSQQKMPPVDRSSLVKSTTYGGGKSGNADDVFSPGNIEDENETKRNRIIRKMGIAVKNVDYCELIRLIESNQRRGESIKVGLFLLCCGAYGEYQKTKHPCLFGNDTWAKNLIMTINEQLENREIQGLAVSTLSAMCSLSKEYMLDIVRHGGVKLVCSIMKKYRESSKTVAACCCAIFYMIDRTVRRNATPLRRTGLILCGTFGIKTVECLVDALTLPISYEAKGWIVDALLNLALQQLPAKDGRSLSEIIKKTQNGQGVNTVIDAINIDTCRPRLFSSALYLLCIFSAESVLVTSKDLVATVVTMSQKIDDKKTH